MLKAGAKLRAFEIVSTLGAGGMGEVYRATDTKLGRDVALKVLPAEMARDPERLARFQREARAVAALNHPQIVTIFSVEEADGIHFITMELVEGQSLDRLIPAGGSSVEQIVAIASALAEALAAAHEKGIIHRDLKPANVMVTAEGRVKVLDFGLAKETRAATHGDATLTSAGNTKAGVVMGTPAYMSPEQITGRAVDHRTDIFALGIVLYEMATGRRPFEGQSSAELISSIMRDTPAPVTESRSDLPANLASIIRRCLEKRADDRFPSAQEIRSELRGVSAAPALDQTATTTGPRPAAPADSGAARADEGFWVAVMPFKCRGASPELEALAEGLTEDIATGLSRFSYLRVIARASTAKYSSESGDVRAIGKELGARYVMEGSLRQAGTKVRIAVQLVDAGSGAGLWAETYDRPFTPEAALDLLDDVVPRIVATVGDSQGILPHSMTAALRNRDPESLTPYEAVLRSLGYHQLVSASEHLVTRTALEHAVKQAPDRADCWAMLSWLYRGEYTHGYNLQPDPLGRALASARRAIELAPSNQLAHAALASAFFYRREFSAFRPAAERALSLNRMEGYVTAFLGLQIAFAGDWEAGCALVERATQLNPNHPGWYWMPLAFNAYRQNDGRRALELVLKINMPGLWTAQLALVVIYSQLGEMEQARVAVRDLLAIRPDFAAIANDELAKWWLPEMVGQLIADLRKAGLVILDPHAHPASAPAPTTAGAQTASGAARVDEGFWVAVLPLKYGAGNADLASLAEGMTEEIVTGLSHFSYLRVIARSSTSRYSNESTDIRSVARDLGARYVMEGGLRLAGTKLRVAVQLVDASTGAHLWAETYDRTFNAEAVFELQDDLVPRIVSTVADSNGVLPHSMSESVRSRDPEQLTPYEAVLRSFGYSKRATAEELSAALFALEMAVRKAPAYGDAWGALAQLYGQDYGQGFKLHADSLVRGLSAAQRAVELAPTNYIGYCGLAQALFFQKDFQSFRNAAERSVALNPMDGNTIAFLGELLIYAGDWERGLTLAGRAKQLNPHHPGWYWYADFYNAYRQCDYRGALNFALKVNLPGHWFAHATVAAACGHLGERDAGSKALRDLLKLRPDFAATMRRDIEKWWEPEYVERLIDGWRKAGLATQDGPPPAALPASISPSIAVLPFTNMSPDPDQEYFADGLAEEIINLLARVPGLKVIARTSAFAFRGKEQDIRGIADALGVRTVLEGSLRRAGNQIRVTAQLINAADGAHLWSERYDREMAGVFALQDEIAAAITAALRIRLSPEAVAPHRYTPKLAAYEAYLKAKYQEAKTTPESFKLSKQYYEQAIALDSDFALAHVGLGHYYLMLTNWSLCPAEEAVPSARRQAERALLLDASLPEAHAILGAMAAYYYLDWKQAARHFDRAMLRQPVSAFVREFYGYFQFLRGEHQQAIEIAEQLIEGDPLEVWPRMNLHAYLQAAGRYGEACEQVSRVLELNPNLVVARVSLAMFQADRGSLPEALQEARRAYAEGPWYIDAKATLAALLRRNGDENEAQSLRQALGSGDAVGESRAHAIFHLLCGEVEQGADWTEKAIEQRDLSMMFYLRFVVCKELRASARWPKIAKMVNLPRL